jgi:hypothetical protein
MAVDPVDLGSAAIVWRVHGTSPISQTHAIRVPASKLTETFGTFGVRTCVRCALKTPDKHLSESQMIIAVSGDKLTEFDAHYIHMTKPLFGMAPANAEQARRCVIFDERSHHFSKSRINDFGTDEEMRQCDSKARTISSIPPRPATRATRHRPSSATGTFSLRGNHKRIATFPTKSARAS